MNTQRTRIKANRGNGFRTTLCDRAKCKAALQGEIALLEGLWRVLRSCVAETRVLGGTGIIVTTRTEPE